MTRDDLSYSEARKLAPHYKALGQSVVFLRADTDFPYAKVTRVIEGGMWRLGGPAACYLIIDEDGLEYRLSVDFEQRDANGRSVHLFDRDRLRHVMGRLSPDARKAFGDMLREQVQPKMRERSAELRGALNSQLDSEECVAGLIAFAEQPDKPLADAAA